MSLNIPAINALGTLRTTDILIAKTGSMSFYADSSGTRFYSDITVDGNIINTDLQNQFNLKTPSDNPTFTGSVSGITKAMVGLDNVDNTTDLSKPISTATQTALDLNAPINNPSFTGSIKCPTINATTQLQVNGVNINSLYAPLPPVLDSYALMSEVSSLYATKSSVNNRAPINNLEFTGTVLGITKAMVGLGNVDNTSDASKPISTATQIALDLKSNLNNPTFTGSVTAPTINASSALQINGTSTNTLYASKPWVQCVVNINGTIFTNSSVGRVTPTITRTSGQSAGAWDISLTSHPNTVAYTHSIQVRTDTGLAFGVISNVLLNNRKVKLYNASQVLTDYQFSLILFG